MVDLFETSKMVAFFHSNPTKKQNIRTAWQVMFEENCIMHPLLEVESGNGEKGAGSSPLSVILEMQTILSSVADPVHFGLPDPTPTL